MKPVRIRKYEFTDGITFSWSLYKHPETCRRLLETILKFKIDTIEYICSEKEFIKNLKKRKARLDVYVEADGKAFDIEMQMSNEGNLDKRMRYYQSMIDSNILDKGEDFNKLRESFIIFFCAFDPYDKNSYLYRFERCCTNVEGVVADTKAHWLVFNFMAFDQCPVETGNTKALLEYLATKHVGNNQLTQEIDTIVEDLNRDEGARGIMSTLEYEYKRKIEKARKESFEFGQKQGIELGENRAVKLSIALVEDGRFDDLKLIQTDHELYEKLCDEYKIN